MGDGCTTCQDSINTVSVVFPASWLDAHFRIFILGLHRDDCLYETDAVKEAIRRLPKEVYDERNYRIIRAMHLSMTKTILPKDQWTKYEEDFKYLEPYLKEVENERSERTEWNTK